MPGHLHIVSDLNSRRISAYRTLCRVQPAGSRLPHRAGFRDSPGPDAFC